VGYGQEKIKTAITTNRGTGTTEEKIGSSRDTQEEDRGSRNT
jgi:hypothetical protein